MASGQSYLIKDLDWKKAVRDSKKRVKSHVLASRGLEFICAAPECEEIDLLVEFTHPITGHKFHVCQFHWKVLSFEMRNMGYGMDTLHEFMKKLADKHGGSLAFAEIRKSVPLVTTKH